jgi:hypothetical protein
MRIISLHTCSSLRVIFRHDQFRLKAQWLLAAVLASASVVAADPIYVDQGSNWTPVARADFYTRDQGSQLIKLAWLKALKHPDGQPFLADQLDRYGYLPNPGNPDGLPVGFTRNGDYAGLNCAACHTRQINVNGQEYRIDGGPALVDAQSFFVALDNAMADVLSSDSNFVAFGNAVLPSPSPDDMVQLKAEVQAWFLRYDTILKRGVPAQSWGPGRLDAVGMIFNRLTGLDIGPAPSRIIAENIRPADAPVRYPFLWNAAIQDITQWPGFAQNGSDILGLARNVGEVYGVFADFEPQKQWWNPLGMDYLHNNSANFDGLGRLEQLIRQIGPPKYPWPTDPGLAAQGKTIYENNCASCHGIRPGQTRFFNNQTWLTPIQDVGTDSHEYDIVGWSNSTGVLEGREIPFVVSKLKPVDRAIRVLTVSVAGAIVEHSVPILTADVENLQAHEEGEGKRLFAASISNRLNQFKLPSSLQDLKIAYVKSSAQTNQTTTSFAYESRVMEGIWAAAPYLHNGSVPTLADLLKPTKDRPTSFKIGPNYDTNNVGMAVDQTKFGDQTLTTSTNRNSGNANCGHEFGTELSASDKKALLEYLKTL